MPLMDSLRPVFKSAVTSQKMLNVVTVWAQHFNVIYSIICMIAIGMVPLKDFWVFIKTTTVAMCHRIPRDNMMRFLFRDMPLPAKQGGALLAAKPCEFRLRLKFRAAVSAGDRAHSCVVRSTLNRAKFLVKMSSMPLKGFAALLTLPNHIRLTDRPLIKATDTAPFNFGGWFCGKCRPTADASAGFIFDPKMIGCALWAASDTSNRSFPSVGRSTVNTYSRMEHSCAVN